MYKQMDFSQLGGLYTYQDTLEYLQSGYSQVLDALAACYGNNLILSGLQVVGSNVSDGWVVLNGEILPVVGGTLMSYLFLETVSTPEQFADGQQRDVYSITRLQFTANADSNISFSDFVRLPFATQTLKDCLQTVQNLFTRLLFSEPVILSGCLITGTNISTGVVYIAGKLLSTVAYTGGAATVYMDANGIYTTTLPASPYIAFDGGTSQYYADVMRRNSSYTGQVIMHANAAELSYFDVTTGLGKWRWKGWKIADVLQSRVPMGYDRRTNASGDAAWDANYNTIGNSGGEKQHTLTVSEMPAHKHSINWELNGTDGVPNSHMLPGGNNEGNGSGTDNTAIQNTGGGTAHENRPPYRVILYIEKI